MKKSLIILIGLVPFLVNAQVSAYGNVGYSSTSSGNSFMVDNIGSRILIKSSYDYSGSPYFGEDYCTADIQVRKGKLYKGLKTKVNLQENTVIYDSAGVELVATAPIDMIRFYDCADPSKNKTLISGLPKVDNLDESSFYIVLAAGNVALLSHIDISYYDRQNNYGRASIIRAFKQHETYYLYVEKKGLIKLETDNASILKQLDSSKEKQVGRFMAQNDIKVKKEKDLVKLFEYYNSLP
jgi:hypothetical protein